MEGVNGQGDILKPPIAKGMPNQACVFAIFQACAKVARTQKMQKMAAAAIEGRYFQR